MNPCPRCGKFKMYKPGAVKVYRGGRLIHTICYSCSDRPQVEGVTEKDGTCLHCKKKFHRMSKMQKFCNTVCRMTYASRNQYRRKKCHKQLEAK